PGFRCCSGVCPSRDATQNSAEPIEPDARRSENNLPINKGGSPMTSQTRRPGLTSHWLLAAVLLAAGCSQKKTDTDNKDEDDGKDLPLGARVYKRQCAQCHGPEGKGDGPDAVRFTNPAPANFTSGNIKRVGSEA